MAKAMIDIKLDERTLRNTQNMLRNIPKALPRVMKNAINKTVQPVRTSMARQLAVKVNAEVTAVKAAQKKKRRKAPKLRFKMKTIKNNVRFQRATNKSWFATLWIKRFKGDEARGSKEPMFIARMPASGHVSIFRRLGAARLPIADQLRRLMVKYFTGISTGLKRQAQMRLYKNIDNQVQRELRRWKAKASKAA